MKLILHAGLHKTGSTAFQSLCAANADALAAAGVVYPTIDHALGQHGQAVHSLQRGDSALLERALREGREAPGGPDKTVLLSAEDLENCLFDLDMADTIERCALDHGIDEIEWLFVVRDAGDYVLSLYAQLPNINNYGPLITLNFEAYAKTVLNMGYFSLQRPEFQHYFIFDVTRFLARFTAHVRGTARTVRMEDFVAGFPGRMVLEPLVGADLAAGLGADESWQTGRNERRDVFHTELSYLFAALGLRVKQDVYDSHAGAIEPTCNGGLRPTGGSAITTRNRSGNAIRSREGRA